MIGIKIHIIYKYNALSFFIIIHNLKIYENFTTGTHNIL